MHRAEKSTGKRIFLIEGMIVPFKVLQGRMHAVGQPYEPPISPEQNGITSFHSIRWAISRGRQRERPEFVCVEAGANSFRVEPVSYMILAALLPVAWVTPCYRSALAGLSRLLP